MTTIALYHFDDSILQGIIDEKVVVVSTKTKSLPKKTTMVVCLPNDMPPETEREEQVTYITLDAFLQQKLTDAQRERYFFERFCLEQRIDTDDVEPADLVKEAYYVSSCQELHAKYVSARTATVHIVEADLTPDLKKANKASDSTYAKALCHVFDTEDWVEGDVVVVRKALKSGCNCGRFMYTGKRLVALDRNIDEDEGNIGDEFAVVSKFPVCYWAAPFFAPGSAFRTIEHNSLVVCEVSSAAMHEIIARRAEIIDKVKCDRANVTLDDRLIVFTEGGVKYGLVCEFGMEVTDLKQHQRECDRILNKSSTKFCAQYPRFKSVLRATEPHGLVTKDAFVSNLEVSANKDYADMVEKIMDHGVSPNNIAFIDCGAL